MAAFVPDAAATPGNDETAARTKYALTVELDHDDFAFKHQNIFIDRPIHPPASLWLSVMDGSWSEGIVQSVYAGLEMVRCMPHGGVCNLHLRRGGNQ